MKAEILSTGDEIRSGAVIDSNSAFIAQKLEEAGLEVVRHACIGDDINIFTTTLKEISNRVDIAVVTGGLGPTQDDISALAASKAAGVELILDETALASIENYFKSRKRFFSPSNQKQAMLPEGSECLFNPVGTAPGFLLTIDKCKLFFLPGVPSEMQHMLLDKVLPRIMLLQGDAREFSKVRNIVTFGFTESATGETLANFSEKFPEVKLGLRSIFPEIHVKLYARDKDESHLDYRLQQATEWIEQKIGKRVVSVDGNSMEAAVGNLLRRQKATLAVAESCTGGLVSDSLTNIPGSSDYFLFSAVTYSNQAKINVLGVPTSVIERYGAVDEKTAQEMAKGVRQISGATYGLSITGIAGPEGGTAEKPVGTVCIGLATPEGIEGRRYNFPFNERSMNKQIFTTTALNLLRRRLLSR